MEFIGGATSGMHGLLVASLHWKAQGLNAGHDDAGSNVCEHVELRRQHAILESHAYKRTLGRQKKVIVLLGGGNTSRRRRLRDRAHPPPIVDTSPVTIRRKGVGV